MACDELWAAIAVLIKAVMISGRRQLTSIFISLLKRGVKQFVTWWK